MEPLKQDTLFSKCQEKLPQPARYLCREWEFIGAATAEQTQCCHNQAKAGLHFAFGALAVASHFIPAFSTGRLTEVPLKIVSAQPGTNTPSVGSA